MSSQARVLVEDVERYRTHVCFVATCGVTKKMRQIER